MSFGFDARIAGALAAGAYVGGSVPFGFLLARARGVDLRAVGSGNIGASNVGRALGRRWAIVTLVLDAGKGLLPVALARAWAQPTWITIVVGLCAVLGHSFSIFLRGRGGKGVATSLGVAFALTPWAALAAFGLFLLVFLPTRISSAGSLAGALGYPLCVWLLGPATPATFAFSGAAAALIVVRHRANITRLVQGRELRA